MRGTQLRKLSASAVLAVLCAGVVAARPAAADHGLPHVEPLARGTFFDSQVAVTVREKGASSTDVMHIGDASDVVVLKITIEPGGLAGWHTHSGTGLLVNTGPGTLTNVVGEDCEQHVYHPGSAFTDPGHGESHAARNLSSEEVVLIATFIGTEGMPVIAADEPEGCAFLD
jgi:quercetin dioxygenase-like cupin family protein